MKGNGLATFSVLAIIVIGILLSIFAINENSKWQYRQISEVKRIGNLNQWKIIYKCYDNDIEKFCTDDVNREYKVGDFYRY